MAQWLVPASRKGAANCWTQDGLGLITVAALVAAIIASLLLSARPALGATFTVSTTADTNDGICDADCSLREAIVAANAAGGADTITLPAGAYTLTTPGAGENAAATGDLDITDDLTINGAGAATTIIDGGSLDRAFDVTGTSTSASPASPSRTGRRPSGGGIYNLRSTNLTDVTVSDNSARAAAAFNAGTRAYKRHRQRPPPGGVYMLTLTAAPSAATRPSATAAASINTRHADPEQQHRQRQLASLRRRHLQLTAR